MTCPHHGPPVIADDGLPQIVQGGCTSGKELMPVFTCNHFEKPATLRRWKHRQRQLVCNECKLWPMRADDEH